MNSQKAREGKLSGWSFGFIANDDEITTEGKDEIRTVTDMDLLEVSILDDTKAPAYYGTSIETREGGARMKEIRADAFEQTEEQTEQPTISIEELANLVAAKVIEALKTEEKAEETEVETEEETEVETEETETEEQTEEKAETEETTEDAEEETEEVETENEETEEQESRSIDYSAFEDRLAKLMK